MQSIGYDNEEVLDKLVPAVVMFAESVARLKLKLSPKAVVTASTHKLALILQKELETYGLTFRVDQKARDVGVTHTAASSKPNLLVQKAIR